jgi:hypothetical protein
MVACAVVAQVAGTVGARLMAGQAAELRLGGVAVAVRCKVQGRCGWAGGDRAVGLSNSKDRLVVGLALRSSCMLAHVHFNAVCARRCV